jgi:hypothetical protein
MTVLLSFKVTAQSLERAALFPSPLVYLVNWEAIVRNLNSCQPFKSSKKLIQ